MRRLVSNLESIMNKSSKFVSVDPTITLNSSFAARWFAQNDRGQFVRPPQTLVDFFPSKIFKIDVNVQKNEFHVPLDIVKIVVSLL